MTGFYNRDRGLLRGKDLIFKHDSGLYFVGQGLYVTYDLQNRIGKRTDLLGYRTCSPESATKL